MASPNNNNINQFLVEKHLSAKKLILNRPKQLNALSFQMISGLRELFISSENDLDVNLVILKGNGRAFCAGGDMASLAHAIADGNWRLGAKFFWDAYSLGYIVATRSTPQVSILNGIVMGGGAGLSINGRFRVATEKTVFATPETSLGLFPDGGASYFLSRLPGFFGEYVGLTGVRLDGSEMFACGLATHFVPSTKLTSLEQELVNVNAADPTIISAVIDKFSQNPPLKENSAYRRLDVIDKCFSKRTVEEILSALEIEAIVNGENWISKAIQSLKNASPISLKITLRSIREGRLLDFGQCLIQEYRMCCHVLRSEISKDFVEGCRSILWDKDRNPKWEPSKLEHVNDQMVDKYFSKVDDKEWKDLVLPVSSHLRAIPVAKL